MVCFVTNARPVSHNVSGSKKNAYKKRLQQEFERKFAKYYPNLPFKKKLATKVIHIHKHTRDLLDVDNLSKPLVDTFCGIIYEDDMLVKYRECANIQCDEYDLLEVSYTGMKPEIAEKLDKYITNEEEHILYFEVSDFRYDKVKIGGSI